MFIKEFIMDMLGILLFILIVTISLKVKMYKLRTKEKSEESTV